MDRGLSAAQKAEAAAFTALIEARLQVRNGLAAVRTCAGRVVLRHLCCWLAVGQY